MTCEKSQEKIKLTFEFIQSFVDQNKYPPSVREICDNVGFKSTASGQYYLNKLEDLGLIKKSSSKNRTIELIKKAKNCVKDTTVAPNVVEVPLLGNVAAGQPLTAGLVMDESFNIPSDFFNCKGEMFLLKVKGDSMIEAGILDGDVVLVRKQNIARDGEIVVAQINNEDVTLKRFYNRTDCVILRPENSAMQDIIVTDYANFGILGVAVGLMRNKI